MKRDEILRAAEQCVCRERQDEYGGPENNFNRIAALWTAYLEVPVRPHDVACMMALLKIARIRTGAGKDDNWIDLAGYAACGGETQEEGRTERNGGER